MAISTTIIGTMGASSSGRNDRRRSAGLVLLTLAKIAAIGLGVLAVTVSARSAVGQCSDRTGTPLPHPGRAWQHRLPQPSATSLYRSSSLSSKVCRPVPRMRPSSRSYGPSNTSSTRLGSFLLLPFTSSSRHASVSTRPRGNGKRLQKLGLTPKVGGPNFRRSCRSWTRRSPSFLMTCRRPRPRKRKRSRSLKPSLRPDLPRVPSRPTKGMLLPRGSTSGARHGSR